MNREIVLEAVKKYGREALLLVSVKGYG